MLPRVIVTGLASALVFAQVPNTLSPAEKRVGWVLLFDGQTLHNWMWSTASDPPEPGWMVEDGLLRTTPGQGVPVYLLTRDSFSDFELAFDWKAGPGANSGIKYRFQGYWAAGSMHAQPEGPGRIEPVALEYQICDDDTNPDALGDARHAAAALYEYWPARKAGPARAGVWHSGRIVARGLHIEHWLDGAKVVDLELDSPSVQQSFARSSRRRSSPILARQERRDSPIALQFHDGTVWFRNVKIRRLRGASQ